MSEDFKAMFEQAAQLRDTSQFAADSAEEATEVAREEVRQLTEAPRGSLPHIEERLSGLVPLLHAGVDAVRASMEGCAAVFRTVDVRQPEHVGIVSAEAQALDATARQTVQIAEQMRLLQEARRHGEGAA